MQSTQIEHLPHFWYLPEVTNYTTRFSERAELVRNEKIKVYKMGYVFFPLVFWFCLLRCVVRVPIRIFMLLYWVPVQYNFKFLFLVGIF